MPRKKAAGNKFGAYPGTQIDGQTQGARAVKEKAPDQQPPTAAINQAAGDPKTDGLMTEQGKESSGGPRGDMKAQQGSEQAGEERPCEPLAAPAGQAEEGERRRRRNRENKKRSDEAQQKDELEAEVGSQDDEAEAGLQCDKANDTKVEPKTDEGATAGNGDEPAAGRLPTASVQRPHVHVTFEEPKLDLSKTLVQDAIITRYNSTLVPGYTTDLYFINSETGKLLPEKIAKMTVRDRTRVYDDFLRRRVQLIHPALCESIMTTILSRTDREIVAMIYDDELLKEFALQTIIDLHKVGYNLNPNSRGGKGKRK